MRLEAFECIIARQGRSGAYTRPWTTGFFIRWNPGQEASEYVCQDNNKASNLMIGSLESVDRGSRIIP